MPLIMLRPHVFSEPIYVTRPLLPPLTEYTALLEQVWESGWLSNNGDQHKALEVALSQYLRAPNLSLFNNGTIALIVACQALRISGEVITTPFTFPATPHILSWNNVTPVFVDIDPVTMTINPELVERMITNRTSAILGVHVYGQPCAVHALQNIADAYGLKVIYDGAHSFGTEIDGCPITEYGDVTMLSFHATKLFHTAEGGALVVRDLKLKERINLLKNFGIKNESEVMMPGINGKMNELQSALGQVVLKYLDVERERRQEILNVYINRLSEIEGVTCFKLPLNVRNSLQYFIIRISEDKARYSRDEVHEQLKKFNIFTRKYFYPLCSEYSCYRMLPSSRKDHLPASHLVANQVMALPFYGGLGSEGAHQVCDALTYILGKTSA
ncbi:MAG TPA: DegT/DnrJ/EryC1/StrS family aminotransferase [Chitinophagales bacterium]|nr:DegT/DnrJ/EryC1/StrS family aminotransferase [Bacteroidota bacterium]HNA58405.1 DegT/DnrJ/EryC1/StrS family aminotransferase [Chitinophagales bacterium]